MTNGPHRKTKHFPTTHSMQPPPTHTQLFLKGTFEIGVFISGIQYFTSPSFKVEQQ